MRAFLFKALCAAFLLFYTNVCAAQKLSSDSTAPVFTADSLASGTSKDVLTNFFQLALTNLTGEKKEFNFNSNPFAVMLRSDSALAIDRNYYKYRNLRKLNFGFGINLDTSYKFAGFSAGVKYALLNKRDTTTSRLLFFKTRNDPFFDELDFIHNKLNDYIVSNYPNIPANHQIRQTLSDAVNHFFNNDKPFAESDTTFQRVVKEIADREHLVYIQNIVNVHPESNIKTEVRRVFDSLKTSIKYAPLWTVGISDTTYKDQFFFSNVLVSTEFVKGVGQPKRGSNLELNLRAGVNFLDNALKSKRDLSRSIFNFEPGLNWVMRTKNNDQSWLEFKLSGAYHHTIHGLYTGEHKDSLTINSTLRIRVFNDVWVPLEIVYDPRSGNVLGFLNVRFNFNTMQSLLRREKT